MTKRQFLTLAGVVAVCVTAIISIAGCVNTIVPRGT